jgi:AbrB family looped-hinge helix DNA binding protein
MYFDIVSIMEKTTLTITSKGQTTIPASIRRKLGLGKVGGVLQISFNESKGELVVAKSPDIDELSEKLNSYIKPDTKPLTDVNAFYRANRQR